MKKSWLPILAEILGISVIVTLLCYVTYIIPLIILFLPIPYIYLACRRGTYWASLGYILTITGVWLLKGSMIAALIAVLLLPPVWIISRLHLKNKFSFETVLKAFASFFIGIALLILIVYLITGQDILTYTLDVIKSAFLSSQKGSLSYQMLVSFGHFDSIVDLTPDNIQTPGFANAFNGIVDIDKIAYTNRAIEQLSGRLGPSLALLCLFSSMAGGYLSYAISHKILQKTKVLDGPLPSFGKWNIPRSFGIAAIVMVGVTFSGYLLSPDSFLLAYSLTRIFVFILYGVQGASLIVHIYDYRGNKNMAIIVILVIFMLLPEAISIVGMGDHIMKIRERFDENIKNHTQI